MPTVNKPNPEDAAVAEAPAETPEAKAEEKKSTKTPLPEGMISPVDFAKKLGEVRGEEIRPQIVYGYLKNMKGFPQVDRGEGVKPRIIIPLQDALDFMAGKAKEAAEKAEAKKAAAAKPAEGTEAAA